MKRFLLLFAVVAALAGAFIPRASALAFDDSVCPPTTISGLGEVHICPQGTAGKPYSVQLKGREGTGCVPYVKFSTNGPLPPGLSLSSSGLISGTPQAEGIWNFYVDMTDIPASEGGPSWCNENPPKQSSRLFQIGIVPGQSQQKLSINQPSLAPTLVDRPFSLQLTASGGGTQTWSIASGTLPPGITLSSGGLLSGTPTAAGSFTFAVRAADTNGTRSATAMLTIVVRSPLSIDKASPQPALVNQPYSLQLRATGGGTVTWSIASGALPPGLALSTAGLLSGTPTTAGIFTFTARVADVDGSRGATATLTIKVVEPVAARAPAKMPAAEVSRPFAFAPAASGGTAPYTWTVTQGGLPEGLALHSATGKVAGVPTAAGAASVTLTVTDADGFTATLPLSFNIKAKLAIASTRLRSAKIRHRYAARIVARAGVAPYKWRLIHGPQAPGIHLDAARGVLVGIPRRAGTFTITVRVRDALGAVSTAKVTFTVRR